MSNFGKSDAVSLFSQLTSHAKDLGVFARVNSHEPASTPGLRVSCSITLASIEADPAASGLAAVSGKITFAVRLWSSMNQKPLDSIDPEVLGAVSLLLGEYAGHFTLGGTVRDVDLLALRAVTAYLQQEGTEFRVVEITLPIIVNDLWAEVA
jgi:hypothetical protein